MATKNGIITDYLSPKDSKDLDDILNRALKNAQTIHEIKQRNAMRLSDLEINEQKIQIEIEHDYKLMNILKQKALNRRRVENALRQRVASSAVDSNTIRELKNKFQSTVN